MNVNTIIIEDADRLGLAQLHQIRGRVGRSARRASAYLTFTRGKELSEIALTQNLVNRNRRGIRQIQASKPREHRYANRFLGMLGKKLFGQTARLAPKH